jgi:hypothetical protein
MIQIGSTLAFRGDAQYISFGKEKEGATLDASTKIFAATAALVLDLGGPYLIGGGGWYRFQIKSDAADQSETEGYWGANAGVGLPLRLVSLHTFVEGRLHTVFPKADEEDGNATFLTVAAGFRFR